MTHKLHLQGIQTDMSGTLIKVGDTVLCKGYYSLDKDTLGTVLKINKKSIIVSIKTKVLKYGEYHPKPLGYVGYWDCYPDKHPVERIQKLKRCGMDVLIVPPNLKQTLETAEERIAVSYPEIFI
jgi:hypothetical protein